MVYLKKIGIQSRYLGFSCIDELAILCQAAKVGRYFWHSHFLSRSHPRTLNNRFPQKSAKNRA
jgi:hypothetical protein